MHTRIIVLMLAVLLVTACAPIPNRDAGDAEQALVDFFDHLQQGDYQIAAELYGGIYEMLVGYNLDIDPNDHPALWERGCTVNGLQCLPIQKATLQEQNDDQFVFLVEFRNPDGSTFVFGPCCGASETEMSPVSEFEYVVIKTDDDEYLVLTPPVLLP